MATEAETAWAAGIFEGEGSITFNGSGGYMPKMVMSSTDLDVLETFARVMAAGAISPRPQRAPHHKPAWSWQCHGTVAHRVFLALRPWLHKRRQERGDEVFARLSGKGPGGHPVTRTTLDGTAKECTGCRQQKSLAAFSLNRHGLLGRESRCRECRRAVHRAYYVRQLEENRRKRREYQARRRAELSR
jgi:hypothetical protein